MADWENNDSGGMDEEQAIKKMIKIVESFNKTMKGGIDLTEKSQVQLMKSILSHQKAYKTDKDHQMWKEQSIEQTKKAHIEVFAERQKELRLSKLINRSLSTQVNTYDKVFKTLGSRTGFGNALSLMTGRLNEMRKTTEMITNQQKIVAKEFAKGAGGNSGVIKSAIESIDVGKKSLEKLTFNNETLKKVAKRLEKLGEFMEKHPGKLIIGAAAISILTGIIAKALNVAPLFQAMMKLMKFAVTMILMPIGTFIAAVIRPMVVGLVQALAPQFGDMMKMSMRVGTALGNWLTWQKDPAGELTNTFENANILGFNQIPDDETPEQKAVREAKEKQAQNDILFGTAAVVGTGAIVGTGAAIFNKYFLKPISNLSNLKNIAPHLNSGKPSSAVGAVDDIYSTAKGKIPSSIGSFTKWVSNGFKTAMPSVLANLSPMLKPLASILSKASLFLLPLDIMANLPSAGADDPVTTERERIQRHGNGLDSIGMGLTDLWSMITGNKNTLDDPLHNNTGSFEKLDLLLTALTSGDGVRDVEASMESTGNMAELFKDITTKMALDDGYMISHDMIAVVNHFNMIEQWATDSEISARDTADLFSMANDEVRSKLAALLNESAPSNPNSPEARAARRQAAETASRMDTNEYGYQTGIGDQGHTGFKAAMDNANFNNILEPVVTPLQKLLDAEAERAKKAFDKVNSSSYNDIYGGDVDTRTEKEKQEARNQQSLGYGDQSGHIYGSSGKTAEEFIAAFAKPQAMMEGIIHKESNKMAMTPSGAIDWASRLNYASGGWINEPVKGIGMNSGKSYSIGERGAEFVSPNGSGSGGGGITINIGKIERTADFNQLKPMIQRWILESNSRRGMI